MYAIARASTSPDRGSRLGSGWFDRYRNATFDDHGIGESFHASGQHRCGNDRRFGIENVIAFAIGWMLGPTTVCVPVDRNSTIIEPSFGIGVFFGRCPRGDVPAM